MGITIYPIKSLPGVSLETARLLDTGALENDRRWALFDEQGRVFNAKKEARFHQIDCTFPEDFSGIELTDRRTGQRLNAQLSQLREIENWFCDIFEQPLKLLENTATGFPDDTNANGPTIIGSQTLKEIASWFPGLTVESLRQRLRSNLELETEMPFQEDLLFGPPEQPRPFQIGEVKFLGINPCQRCVVPSRDPQTGEVIPMFPKQFAQKRKETLPGNIASQQFNHFYRIAVNTRMAPQNTGFLLNRGDLLESSSNSNKTQ
ncbi:hypothetical protein Pan54_44050 [Rubinisphaera italica]|uniref:MOSC domain-containing protein n=2 Tax=Rubinisphaera italica TaxID=2527969 RepID=A0A5C5XL37_9PLAN|nr:hypothetical protein Pan54_44050 [Rubinisphaera italica]